MVIVIAAGPLEGGAAIRARIVRAHACGSRSARRAHCHSLRFKAGSRVGQPTVYQGSLLSAAFGPKKLDGEVLKFIQTFSFL